MFIVSIGVSVTVIQNIYGVNWDVVLDDGFYFSFCIDFQFTANILVSILLLYYQNFNCQNNDRPHNSHEIPRLRA